MTEAIGIRIDSELLEKVDRLAKDEHEDRSTVLRKLISKGYTESMKERAAELYKHGKLTLSAAATQAGLTLWEMQRYLVERGFISTYSVVDLMEEATTLAKKNLKQPEF
ncbi:UPF0175 family protein [Candidatus Woesearchaeota archaeon]|nr:UPF0175 family protein [Candidatus Woesearchaeota archaeon]